MVTISTMNIPKIISNVLISNSFIKYLQPTIAWCKPLVHKLFFTSQQLQSICKAEWKHEEVLLFQNGLSKRHKTLYIPTLPWISFQTQSKPIMPLKDHQFKKIRNTFNIMSLTIFTTILIQFDTLERYSKFIRHRDQFHVRLGLLYMDLRQEEEE